MRERPYEESIVHDYCATRRPRGSLCTLLHGSVGACLRAVRRCRERAWGLLLLLFNLTPIHVAIPPAKTKNTSRLLNRISRIVVSKIHIRVGYEHLTCQRPKLRDKEALTRYVESHEGESQTNRDETHVQQIRQTHTKTKFRRYLGSRSLRRSHPWPFDSP